MSCMLYHRKGQKGRKKRLNFIESKNVTISVLTQLIWMTLCYIFLGESRVEIELVLPWRDSVSVCYNASTAWPVTSTR